MTDPALTGQRVLDALAAGRRRAIAQARALGSQNERAVREALDVDILAGHKERGRAARIASGLRVHGCRLTRRTVQRILDRLSSVSRSKCSDPAQSVTEGHDE